MRKLPRYQYCFVCGQNNNAGLNVTWIQTDEGVQGDYTGQEKHNSYKGIVHGGILSALLDECIGWAVGIKDKNMYVTGGLNITFKTPMLNGKKVTVKGYLSKDQIEGKKYRKGNGVILGEDGTVHATAEGIFFPIPVEFQKDILKLIEMPDDPIKEITFEDIWGEPVNDKI